MYSGTISVSKVSGEVGGDFGGTWAVGGGVREQDLFIYICFF